MNVSKLMGTSNFDESKTKMRQMQTKSTKSDQAMYDEANKQTTSNKQQ